MTAVDIKGIISRSWCGWQSAFTDGQTQRL